MIVNVYTDGACENNQVATLREGAYGAVIQIDNGDFKYIGGYSKGSTNNQMELTAVIKSLASLKDLTGATINIFSDSTYTLGAIDKVAEYKANNWRNKSKKTPENLELLKELDAQLECVKANNVVKPVKVKAHAGIEGNELADRVCKSFIAFNTGKVSTLEDAINQLAGVALQPYNGIPKQPVVAKQKPVQSTKYISYNGYNVGVTEQYKSKVERLFATCNDNTNASVIKVMFTDVMHQVEFLKVVPEIMSIYDMIRIIRGSIDIDKALAYIALFAKSNILGKTATLRNFASNVTTHKVYLGLGHTTCITKVTTENFTGKELQDVTFTGNVSGLTKAEMLQLHREMLHSADYKSAIGKLK